MRLVTAILARDEAAPDRYLRRVLTRCAEFSDAILVLDDGSTDATAAIAREAGGVVHTRRGAAAWGAEAPARQELWERAAALADGGWVLICDADMLLVGDPRPLTYSWDVASWAWPLVDLWDSEETFRVDGAWQFGPRTPRPWLFRPSVGGANFAAQWGTRGIHVGHAPANFGDAGPSAVAPDLFWKHLAYVQREHREAKAAQYAATAAQLTAFERAHAASILD